MFEGIQVELHCSVGSRRLNVYLFPNFCGVDWCKVLLLLWIVESPDTTNRIAIIVDKPRITNSPNCKYSSVLANDLVSVSIWWFMCETLW